MNRDRFICASKNAFVSKDIARRHVRRQRRRSQIKIRTYHCHICGCWHLSSRLFNQKGVGK